MGVHSLAKYGENNLVLQVIHYSNDVLSKFHDTNAAVSRFPINLYGTIFQVLY